MITCIYKYLGELIKISYIYKLFLIYFNKVIKITYKITYNININENDDFILFPHQLF